MSKSNTQKQDAGGTVVERIVEDIRKGIRDGRYVPAQRLVEADLTEALGVSRGPLREAMWRLAGERLLVMRPNRGVSVRALSREEVSKLYQVREVLEGLAASLAAGNINSGNNRNLLEAVWRELDSAHDSGNANTYTTLNERFHTLIVELADNTELGHTVAQMRLPLFRMQFRGRMGMEQADKGHAEHAKIVDAIASGDCSRAERVMRGHVRKAWKLIDALEDDAFH